MNLDGIEPHWLWLIAAAIVGIAELLIPGLFLIWLAIAAGLTGLVVAMIDLPPAFQLILFGLFALAAVYFGRGFYARNHVASSDPLLNDRGARLIGETVEVVAAIRNGAGRVKVGDSVWPARGPDAEIGACVRVTGVDGATLKVVALEAPRAPAAD